MLTKESTLTCLHLQNPPLSFSLLCQPLATAVQSKVEILSLALSASRFSASPSMPVSSLRHSTIQFELSPVLLSLLEKEILRPMVHPWWTVGHVQLTGMEAYTQSWVEESSEKRSGDAFPFEK